MCHGRIRIPHDDLGIRAHDLQVQIRQQAYRIVTADGTSLEIASETMYYNKELIVAFELDGEALPQEYWPLRIVGEGIDASDMVGQITEIEALLPAE